MCVACRGQYIPELGGYIPYIKLDEREAMSPVAPKDNPPPRYVYMRDSHREVYHIIEVKENNDELTLPEYRADRLAEVFSEEIAVQICRGLEMQQQSIDFVMNRDTRPPSTKPPWPSKATLDE